MYDATLPCSSPLLGNKIPLLVPLTAQVHDASAPHPLQDIPYRLLWVEIDADLLRAEAFGMFGEECQYPLAQGAALAAAPGLGWRCRLWDRLRISNVTVTCICDTRHLGMGVCAGLPPRCLWHSYRNYICNSISNRCQRGLHRCQLLPDKLAYL